MKYELLVHAWGEPGNEANKRAHVQIIANCECSSLCHANFARVFITSIISDKSHPNIYKLVDLFKTEQVATEVTLRQLKAGGVLAPKGRRTELKRKG